MPGIALDSTAWLKILSRLSSLGMRLLLSG